MIVILRLGLREFGRDFDTEAPPHNHYRTESGSKRISTAQTLAPNESLLRRLWLQTNHYCADSVSKRISTAQTLAPNDIIYARWQRPYWDALASLFYSGRKWRWVVHLFLQSMVVMSKSLNRSLNRFFKKQLFIQNQNTTVFVQTHWFIQDLNNWLLLWIIE